METHLGCLELKSRDLQRGLNFQPRNVGRGSSERQLYSFASVPRSKSCGFRECQQYESRTAALQDRMNGRCGTFAPDQGELRPNFAKCENCALLPLEHTAANARNPPFVPIFATAALITMHLVPDNSAYRHSKFPAAQRRVSAAVLGTVRVVPCRWNCDLVMCQTESPDVFKNEKAAPPIWRRTGGLPLVQRTSSFAPRRNPRPCFRCRR